MTEHPLYDLLRTLRMDLTAAQGKLTEALRQIGELELPGEPATADCKWCGKIPGGPRSLSEHLYVSHGGTLPEHWAIADGLAADWPPDETWAVPGDARQQAADERGPEWDAPAEWRQDVQKIRLALGPRLAKRVGLLLVRVQELTDERNALHSQYEQGRAAYGELEAEKRTVDRRVQEAERALREIVEMHPVDSGLRAAIVARAYFDVGGDV